MARADWPDLGWLENAAFREQFWDTSLMLAFLGRRFEVAVGRDSGHSNLDAPHQTW